MAKTYLATKGDVTNVQSQVTLHDDDINDPDDGLKRKVYDNRQSITTITNFIGQDNTQGMLKRITDNENAIGDENSGLIKGQNDLVDIVGTDNTEGLQKRATDLEGKTADLNYNDTTKRFSSTSEPTETASVNTDILTKKDGDALYGESVIKSDAGALNTATDTTDWTTFVEVGNIKVEGRYSSTVGNSQCRVVQSTGGTAVFIWSSINGSVSDTGATGVSNEGAYEIASSTDEVIRFSTGIYTSSGVNTEAYTVDVFVRHLANGVRMAASIVAKF